MTRVTKSIAPIVIVNLGIDAWIATMIFVMIAMANAPNASYNIVPPVNANKKLFFIFVPQKIEKQNYCLRLILLKI